MAATQNGTMIEVSDLWKAFGPLQVLKGISLEVPKGSAVALIGPSGSGKSTLLRCINLLEMPERGRVRVGDQMIDCARGKLPADKGACKLSRSHRHGLPAVQPVPAHDCAAERQRRTAVREEDAAREAKELAMALLAKVDLADKADAYPSHLSGGQRQRWRSLARWP